MRTELVLSYLTALLVLGYGCNELDRAFPEGNAPVLFSLDTKALGEGERTYRVGLFSIVDGSFHNAQGTYCNVLIDHSATVGGGIWLSPCRVDLNGNPLKTDGEEATGGLAEADRNSSFGLRYPVNGDQQSFLLAASSPAKAFLEDGAMRYYAWNSSSELYVTDAKSVTLRGTWLDNEYVYASSEKDDLILKDRRARLYVHIECGELPDAYIQEVNILNRVYSARWYMTQGFSHTAEHYATDVVNLYTFSGMPMHMEKTDPSHPWTSDADVYLPSIDYSNMEYAAMRPVIEIKMGNTPPIYSRALVYITQPMNPMVSYTFNLYVSKANVRVYLSSDEWNDGGAHNAITETPSYIGTVTVYDEWDDGGTLNASGWNESFE